jgi:hypothetical protein
MWWWYWEHVKRTRLSTEAMCPSLFAPSGPTAWQWIMLILLDAPLATSVMVTVLALHPRSRGLFNVTLAQSLYLNSLLLLMWSFVVPGIQADEVGCRHEVHDRPCEEAAILVLVLLYTAVYDIVRGKALHYSTLQVVSKWISLLLLGALGCTAQSQLHFFDAIEVMAGAVVGAGTAVVAAVWTIVVVLPLRGRPVAQWNPVLRFLYRGLLAESKE